MAAGWQQCISSSCSTVPTLQSASEALLGCEAILRLGFHAASSGTNRAAMHGVATAIHSIRHEGGDVVVTWYPIRYSQILATRTALELVQNVGVHVVIGGGSSAISSSAQTVCALAGVPQIAYSATSPLLSDRISFPTFNRVVPPDTFQGHALAYLCKTLGWRRVGIVSSDDEYARSIARVFGVTFRAMGGRELFTSTFSVRHGANCTPIHETTTGVPPRPFRAC